MATDLSPCHFGDGIEALNRLPWLEPSILLPSSRMLARFGQNNCQNCAVWISRANPSSPTLYLSS
jgi:hypothetical protein